MNAVGAFLIIFRQPVQSFQHDGNSVLKSIYKTPETTFFFFFFFTMPINIFDKNQKHKNILCFARFVLLVIIDGYL